MKQIDLFGQEVKLNYQNDDQYKSAFGGFFTVGFIIVLTILFWGQISDFLLMQDVEVKEEQSYSSNPSKVTIDPKEMIFALKITQDNFIKKPYYNVTFQDRYYYRENGEQFKEKNDVQLVQCTEEHFSQLNNGDGDIDFLYTYDLLDLGDFLCLPLNYEVNLGGNYASEEFFFQKITVSDCVNSTDVIDDSKTYESACAPEEEIQNFKKYSDVTFTLYFPNLLVNPDNPDKPVRHFFFDEVFFELQPEQMYKSANILFKKLTISTDYSLLPWQEYEDTELVIFEPGDFREFNKIYSGDGVAAEFYLRRSGYDIGYDRSYRKLDDIVAYLGGFMEFVIIGATFFIGYYNDLQYSLSLANQLYNFEYKEKNESVNSDDDDDDDDDEDQQEKIINALKKQNFQNQQNRLMQMVSNGNGGDENALNSDSSNYNNKNNNNNNDVPDIENRKPNESITRKNKGRKTTQQRKSVQEIRQIILQRKMEQSDSKEKGKKKQKQQVNETNEKVPNIIQNDRIPKSILEENESNNMSVLSNNNQNGSNNPLQKNKQTSYFNNDKKNQNQQQNNLTSSIVTNDEINKNQNQAKKFDKQDMLQSNDNKGQIEYNLLNNQQQKQISKQDSPLKPDHKDKLAVQNLVTFQDQIGESANKLEIPPGSQNTLDNSEQNSDQKQPEKPILLNNNHDNDAKQNEKDLIANNNNLIKNQIKNSKQAPNIDIYNTDAGNLAIAQRLNSNENLRNNKYPSKIQVKMQSQNYKEMQDTRQKQTSFVSTKAATNEIQHTTTKKKSDLSKSKFHNTTMTKASSNKSRYDPALYEGLGFTSRREFLTKQFEEIVNRNTKVQLTWRFFLNKLFFGKLFVSEEVVLIEKAKEMIRKELDIHYIIDQIKDIDKLKNVFLNKEQQVLFNFFPRPVIKQDDDDFTKQSFIPEEKAKNMKIEDIVQINKVAQQFKSQLLKKEFKHVTAFQNLYEAYEILMKQTSSQFIKSYENKRLIKLLGQEMSEIFETSKLIKFERDMNSNYQPSEIPLKIKKDSDIDKNASYDFNSTHARDKKNTSENTFIKLFKKDKQNQEIEQKEKLVTQKNDNSYVNTQQQQFQDISLLQETGQSPNEKTILKNFNQNIKNGNNKNKSNFFGSNTDTEKNNNNNFNNSYEQEQQYKDFYDKQNEKLTNREPKESQRQLLDRDQSRLPINREYNDYSHLSLNNNNNYQSKNQSFNVSKISDAKNSNKYKNRQDLEEIDGNQINFSLGDSGPDDDFCNVEATGRDEEATHVVEIANQRNNQVINNFIQHKDQQNIQSQQNSNFDKNEQDQNFSNRIIDDQGKNDINNNK